MTIEQYPRPLTSGDLELLPDEELENLIRREHVEVTGSLVHAVQHAIRVGQALLITKERIGKDLGQAKWHDLLGRVDISTGTATRYMRVAAYREHIPPSEMRGIERAAAWVRGLPAVTGGRGMGGSVYPDGVRDEALRLRRQGLTLLQVTEVLGVSKSAVSDWENPEKARARQRLQQKHAVRRKRTAEAMKRQERADAVKRVGGAPSEAYSFLRKSMLSLQRAIDESVDPEAKSRLRKAYNSLTDAEDDIARALRVP